MGYAKFLLCDKRNNDLSEMSSMIDHKCTGLHFRPGDPDDLATQVDWIISHPAELERVRQEVRAECETKYTAERNYEILMDIYETAIKLVRKKSKIQI